MSSTRVAIVTGASSGIGEATAQRLHDAGFTVYAVARRVDRMADLEEIGVRTVRTDLSLDAIRKARLGIYKDNILADVSPASSYLSSSDPRIHWGLGEVPLLDTLEIRWPSGQNQTLLNVAADRILRVDEPQPEDRR